MIIFKEQYHKLKRLVLGINKGKKYYNYDEMFKFNDKFI